MCLETSFSVWSHTALPTMRACSLTPLALPCTKVKDSVFLTRKKWSGSTDTSLSEHAAALVETVNNAIIHFHLREKKYMFRISYLYHL